MKPIYRRILIFVVAVVAIVGLYFGYIILQKSVPRKFSEARSQVAMISERIVSSSNEIGLGVAKLNSATSTPAQVSSTLSEVTAKVAEVRSQAVELATTLENMTKATQDINSSEAQQAALQSISHRISLANHLVTYTDQVSRLATAIRLRLEGGLRNSQEINALVKNINEEIGAINEFSRQADEAMDRFDSLLR